MDTRAAWQPSPIFETVKLKDRLVQIVRINVVAGFTGSGWERATADMIQYAVLEGAGESV